MRILIVLGTRPEAIKLALVIRKLEAAGIDFRLCVTGQHRELLDQALASFDLRADFDLDLLQQTSREAMPAAITEHVAAIIAAYGPDWVVVQGDTTSALNGALAAASAGIPVAHVEAGLRTGNLASPYPEEGYRRTITTLASLHFAPTPGAAANLRGESVAEGSILVTGNTAVDALQAMSRRLDADPAFRLAARNEIGPLTPGKRRIFVTGHRSENLGRRLGRVAEALRTIGTRGDVEILLPTHPNPGAQDFASLLRSDPAVRLLKPLSYPACLLLMSEIDLIVTDSGGLQEEAPSFGVPVLVTRPSTERPEAILAGAARIVGTKTKDIVAEVSRLLDDPAAYAEMAQVRSPFGDGCAADRIVAALAARSSTAFYPGPDMAFATQMGHGRAVRTASAPTDAGS